MGDLDPNDYNGNSLIIVCTVFLALTYLSVGLRVFVRIKILKTFSLDDWLMIVAQIVFTLSCSFIIVGVHYGIGRHNKSLATRAEIEALKYQTLATLTYVGNMMFIKLSIAIFLLRIATKKRYTWTLKISMAVVTIWSLAILLFDIFQCTPVAAQWDFTIMDFHCAPGTDFVNAAYSISVMTVITDWMYAIIPIPMIWSVQMTTQKKMTVAFVLSLGVFASIATLIRVKYLVELGTYDDILFTGTTAMVWTLVEPGVAITAASLITIRPLLRALNINGFSSGSTRNTSRHMGSTGLSQTLQNRSQNMNTSQNQYSGGDFALKSWNNISGGAMGDRDQKGIELMRTETTAVSDTGSEEFILRRDANGNREEGDDGMGIEEVEPGPGQVGIRRTVVVRIQSAPHVLGANGKTGGTRNI